MPQITVLAPFLLNLGGTLKKFEAGVVEVAEEVASHWYVKLFTAPVEEATPPTTTEVGTDPAPPEDTQAEPSVTTEDDGSTHVDTQEEVDEKASLKAEAEALGIDVDGRWGVGRLKTEIEAKKNAA